MPPEHQQIFYLALQGLPGLGASAAKQLLHRYPGVDAFWGTPSPPTLSGVKAEVSIAVTDLWQQRARSAWWQQALLEYEKTRQLGIVLVSWQDVDYPPLLRQAPDCPALLGLRGTPSIVKRPQLAIVGSRNASRAGMQIARQFAAELASTGLVICSGLALGIDGEAHQGALDTGGETTAVLGTGLDRVYPARHRDLARAVAERGALISEFSLGTPPRPGHFPRRNRIIAGMCVGTLVVEAAERSGSLITARLALDYNREVFAIPGSIHNPRSRGAHALIRQGAKLVETAEHVVEEIASLVACHVVTISADPGTAVSPDTVVALSETAGAVLDAIDTAPTCLDQIIDRTGLPAAELAELLIDLELAGRLEANSSGWQRIR